MQKGSAAKRGRHSMQRKSRWEERLMNLTPLELRKVYEAMELIVYRSAKPANESHMVGVEAMRN